MRLHIRVSFNDDKSIRLELMEGDTKLKDVSRVDVIEMILQFTSCLRY